MRAKQTITTIQKNIHSHRDKRPFPTHACIVAYPDGGGSRNTRLTVRLGATAATRRCLPANAIVMSSSTSTRYSQNGVHLSCACVKICPPHLRRSVCLVRPRFECVSWGPYSRIILRVTLLISTRSWNNKVKGGACVCSFRDEARFRPSISTSAIAKIPRDAGYVYISEMWFILAVEVWPTDKALCSLF